MSLDDYFLRNWSDPLLAVFRCRKGIINASEYLLDARTEED